MLEIIFLIFLTTFCLWAGLMAIEPRSLWSGILFFLVMLNLGGLLLATAAIYQDWLIANSFISFLFVLLAGLAGLFVLALPLLLLILFLVQGVRVVRHEGLSPSNLLSLAFAVLWFGFLFVWPIIGVWEKGSLGTAIYIIISFSAVYLLALMAMYVLSALLNLIHLRKKRHLNYIIVLGAGLNGSQVTPLLAGRINRGIQLLERNPQAFLIMSGGQGPGENLPESAAMAAYAGEKGVDPGRILQEQMSSTTEENLRFSRALMEGARPRVAIVTTSYHVFRALLLAKRQGMRCVGFGAETKWYFTLNAILREFAGYLKLTRKRHLRVIIGMASLVLAVFLLSQII